MAHRIDTPTAQKDKFGAGKNGFTRGNPQTATPATDLDDDYFDMLQEELVGIVESANITLDKAKRNQVVTALKALFLSRANPFADIKADGAAAIATALANLGLKEAATGVGVVGDARKASMQVSVASSIATFTAEQIIVETSGGKQYRINAFNKSVNLATTGAGGMDTGTVPVTGYVALYAIYNPTTSVSALLTVDATTVKAPEIYGGTNLPAGYTASALVSVWPTATSQFIPGTQVDRRVEIGTRTLLSSSSIANKTTFNSNLLPLNAKNITGSVTCTNTASSIMTLIVWGLGGVGGQAIQATLQSSQAFGSLYADVSVDNQNIIWSSTSSGGTPTFTIALIAYRF